MADEVSKNGLKSFKRKRKHSGDLMQLKKSKEKKTVQSKRDVKAKQALIIQPQLPKTAKELSSNWKLLQAVRDCRDVLCAL